MRAAPGVEDGVPDKDKWLLPFLDQSNVGGETAAS